MSDNIQMKVYVPRGTANAFKSLCSGLGVTVSSEMSRLMASRAGAAPEPASLPIETRGNRRKAVQAILAGLQLICDKENDYLDNIPENLRSAPASEASEFSLEQLSAAIDALSDAY
jgi:hypothetical protein